LQLVQDPVISAQAVQKAAGQFIQTL